ncbi:MAG TPA: hypothetical protein VH414_21625 [Lichenihabitans sp.]|jgi:hypothetical protein|nr:hypothetical protein [Lichenihabitans sp.]
MKREPKPFVVELKRGARRSAFLSPRDAVEPMSDAVRRAERALFAGGVEADIPARPPAVEPPGRVLQSLIEPHVTMAVDAGQPERPASRRGRKPGSKNKPKAANAAPKPEAPPSTTSERSPGEDAIAAESAASAPSIAPAGSRVSRIAWPRRDHPVEGDAAAASPTDPGPSRRQRLRERSSILARYVFETEPVPGERWKRSARRTGRGRRSLARLD